MEFEEPRQRESCCRKEKECDMSNIKFVNSSGLYFGPRISGGKSVRMFNPTYKLHGHIYNPTTNSKLPWATQSCSMGWIPGLFPFHRTNQWVNLPTSFWKWNGSFTLESFWGRENDFKKLRYPLRSSCILLRSLEPPSFEKPQGWWRIDLFEGWKCLTVSNMSFFVHKIYSFP